MRKTFFILVILTSCQDFNKSEITNSNLKLFLNNFEEISLQNLKKIDFDKVQSKNEIDSLQVSNFLCDDVKNSCFYTNSSLKNTYFSLFKLNYSENTVLLFYVLNEQPYSIKVYVSSLNLKEEIIKSKLLISTFLPNQENYIDVELNDEVEFKIIKTFNSENYTEESINNLISTKIIETYLINDEGSFTLKESFKRSLK